MANHILGKRRSYPMLICNNYNGANVNEQGQQA